MHVKSISKSIESNDDYDLLFEWYRILDELYFSHDQITIELSEEDKKIMNRLPECKSKLRVLSYKKNIKILNYEFD